MKLVIFDCDGVLVDSEAIANALLARHLRAAGVDLTDQAVSDAFKGRSAAGCIELMQRWLTPAQAQSCWQACQAETLEALAQVQPVVGIHSVLSQLVDEGVKFCVASSGDHAKMAVTLAASGIAGAFQPRCFSVTEVAHPKPAPDVFLYAAQQMGFAPSQCVVVEDSLTGVRAARAAAMPVCWYGGMPEQAEQGDRVFTHMNELPGLLRNLGVLN